MSSGKGFTDDASFLLYLVPFIASGVYGLAFWLANGVSSVQASDVYLTVTRDPYVFMVGSLAVLAGVLLEVRSGDQEGWPARVKSAGDTLQTIAIASIALSLVGVWAATGFVHLSQAFTDFMLGRYSVVFPAMLVFLSYLITIDLKLDTFRNPKVLGVIALLLVPAAVYEIGKRDTAGGLAIGLALAMIGMWVFVRGDRKATADQK